MARSGEIATAIFAVLARGLSGALGRHADTMYDVCDASLYKNSIVPASNDIRKSIFMHDLPKIAL